MIVRPATLEDVPALMSLYNDLGVATTASYDLEPVPAAERLAWLWQHQKAGWPVLVAVEDGVIGYAAYGAFRPKAGYAHTAETSVYVREDHQRAGVGRDLMGALIDIAREHDIHALISLVDAENDASIRFHESLGFTTVGTLPQVGRKFDRWLSLTMQVLLLEPAAAEATPPGTPLH